MALTIKHLNADASFLLIFEPLLSRPVPGYEPKPFHILLDPCITNPSKLFLPMISRAISNKPACISSLNDLPQPDLVIISQHKSDHCSESTLRQIPPTAKTIILAEPSAAKMIRGWKHFDRQNVLAMGKWEGPPRTGGATSRGAVIHIPVPPVSRGGEPGEVTVAFIPQRRDLSGLHSAVGITYRPPPTAKQAPPPPPSSQRKLSHACRSGPQSFPPTPSGYITPPMTPPRSHKSFSDLPAVFTEQSHAPTRPLPVPPPAPTSPGRSIRPARSVPTLKRSSTAMTTGSSISYASAQRTLSVIFSPHGTVFEGNLGTYATSHLVKEAALPLTALLHCLDAVSNPWWRGGNVLLGAPVGKEIAVRLGATCWVSCYDKRKDARGSATSWLKTSLRCGGYEAGRVLASEVEEDDGKEEISGRQAEERLSRTTTLTCSPATSRCCSKGAGQCGNRGGKETPVFTLAGGEEMVLTSEGVWNVDRRRRLLGAGKTDDACIAARPRVDSPVESLAEAKPKRKKRVAFHPLGEVITTGRRR